MEIFEGLVPAEARERLSVRFGPGVLAWCEALPVLVGEFAARWGLELSGADGGGTSRVFRCRREDGSQVWLKLTPDPVIAREEAEALRSWAGSPSVVSLLEGDLEAGVLLLGGVEPGVPALRSSWSVPQAAALLRGLRDASPLRGEGSVLRPLEERVRFLFDLAGRGPAASLGGALERGRAAALELASGGHAALVHGDLHPGNVLWGPGGRLVAIDPRPAWGDPDFDAVDWALEGVRDGEELERRAAELASLVPGSSPERVLGWCGALAVLLAASRLRAGLHGPETRFLVELASR
ncbi:aminoglycoside phosphotransferase family protein [Actinocorallia populi]|uniref:aminoglycoside phosphotransferase family protein n=1 Tax=Actinocorallia populi TaxID=2079200 RepID=UPI000D08F055|nr:aminoglycoside phosphotransferase family protein [Actinocorallia populi]